MVLLISQVRVYAQVSVLGRFRYTLGCQVWWRGQLRFTPRFLVLFHSIQSCPWEPVPAAPATVAAPLLTGSSCSVSTGADRLQPVALEHELLQGVAAAAGHVVNPRRLCCPLVPSWVGAPG